MITTAVHTVAPGITLHCRVAGPVGAPTLLFLHGFPEGAFVWDALLTHFSQPENGGYRCVAPWLRGFGPSSAPTDARDYRPKHLVQDAHYEIIEEAVPTKPRRGKEESRAREDGK